MYVQALHHKQCMHVDFDSSNAPDCVAVALLQSSVHDQPIVIERLDTQNARTANIIGHA
jgi:hypothetical protein